jgi:23S rRNA pseudouridine1911/1915/1917 synthase
MLPILHEDQYCIIVNKPVGLPTQPDLTNDASALDIVTEYCRRELFIIHRLDRPASGVLLFAKGKGAASAFSELFQKQGISKKYWAIVRNQPPAAKGKLVHYIKKDAKTKKSFAYAEPAPDTKKAVLSYELLAKLDNFFHLEIELQTGRFHQIRCQLAAADMPIKGDLKYGAKRSNADRSIHLHARQIAFTHPIAKTRLNITADPPEDAIWNAVSF